MKLSHVVVLSILGMLVASLSVLVLTQPRKIPTQDVLTSNDLDTSTTDSSPPNAPIIVKFESAVPSASPSAQPLPFPSQDQQPHLPAPQPDTSGRAELILFAPNEPCNFSLDGVRLDHTDMVDLHISVGKHVIRCDRPNGRTIEQRVDIVPESRNPYFF